MFRFKISILTGSPPLLLLWVPAVTDILRRNHQHQEEPMAKGEDAVMRKKNKTQRKRMKNSESAVSARIAAIIASKRRRKAGKRRACEGMCFSLPTLEDPFNDRHDRNNKKLKKNNINNDNPIEKPKPNPIKTHPPNKTHPNNNKKHQDSDIDVGGVDCDVNFEDGCISKFLTLCLNAIQNFWNQEEGVDAAADDGGVSGGGDGLNGSHLLASSWGAELWRRCSSGVNVVVDSSGDDCTSKEQLAWLLSMAADIIARREKQGHVVASPFLLFLVPSQQKAAQVRSVCKPLKALGIHTVSLHPGAPIDHQIHGLNSCEPEFLVSTPDRLLELVHLQAIDISGVSLLVLDDMKSLLDFGFSNKIESIKETISGQPQTVIFSACGNEIPASPLQRKEPVCRISLGVHQKTKET